MSIAEEPTTTPTAAVDTRAAISCTHCGLPVPKGLIESDSNEQFCCSGCRTAYRVIHSCGLDAFYSMAETSGIGSLLRNRDSDNSKKRFAEFDQPSFIEKFGKLESATVNEVSLALDGIHCAACLWLIEKLPQIVPGVLEAKLNWARQSVRIRWASQEVRLSEIAGTLYRLGYAPHPIRRSEDSRRRQHENRKHLIRIGIAAAAAGNNMLIAASLYLGMFSYMSVGMSQMLRIASCIVGLASLIWPGRVFLQGAVNSIRTRTPHMDLPIALGLMVGTVAGIVNTIRGTGEIYFDSISVLIFLLLVGRWIQFRQQNRAADSVEMLHRLTPKTTRKIVDGRPVETFVDLVVTDDLLEVRPGDLIPVDAVIVNGTSEIDESILSGESRPRLKTMGDVVLAGTQNRQSVITVKATATGRQTRLSKIVELVEEASLDKPEIVQWANRIGGQFVVAVIGMSALTLVSWLWIDASVAVDRTVALLIVACPCALALATPLAISVALGRAAKRKIMIKGGDVLQRLNQPGMIWLDKTGTLTVGELEVVRWYGETNWQTSVAALESKSNHMVASAIVESVSSGSLTQPEIMDIENVTEHVRGGIGGTVNGHEILVGTEKLILSHDVPVNLRWKKLADDILKEDQSPCWIAVDHQVVAMVAIGDRVRADAVTAVNQLKQSGWQVGILSGDHESIVSQVAARLEIDPNLTHGGVTPEEKVDLVRDSMNRSETVVMVGDGVNDCAALAAASVGIAVHNGAEASLAAAPVYLAGEGLGPILELIQISQSTCRTIRCNFAASLTYNVFGATFAAIGWIDPLVAAILMPISSLTVVAISLTAGKSQTGKG